MFPKWTRLTFLQLDFCDWEPEEFRLFMTCAAHTVKISCAEGAVAIAGDAGAVIVAGQCAAAFAVLIDCTYSQIGGFDEELT